MQLGAEAVPQALAGEVDMGADVSWSVGPVKQVERITKHRQSVRQDRDRCGGEHDRSSVLTELQHIF